MLLTGKQLGKIIKVLVCLEMMLRSGTNGEEKSKGNKLVHIS